MYKITLLLHQIKNLLRKIIPDFSSSLREGWSLSFPFEKIQAEPKFFKLGGSSAAKSQGWKLFKVRSSCKGVYSIHWRLELQTSTEIQVSDISPGSCVLSDKGAILFKLHLPSFSIFHQTVVTVYAFHHGFHSWLGSLKPLLLSTKCVQVTVFSGEFGTLTAQHQQNTYMCLRGKGSVEICAILKYSNVYLRSVCLNKKETNSEHIDNWSVSGVNVSTFSHVIPFKGSAVFQCEKNRDEGSEEM